MLVLHSVRAKFYLAFNWKIGGAAPRIGTRWWWSGTRVSYLIRRSVVNLVRAFLLAKVATEDPPLTRRTKRQMRDLVSWRCVHLLTCFTHLICTRDLIAGREDRNICLPSPTRTVFSKLYFPAVSEIIYFLYFRGHYLHHLCRVLADNTG